MVSFKRLKQTYAQDAADSDGTETPKAILDQGEIKGSSRHTMTRRDINLPASQITSAGKLSIISSPHKACLPNRFFLPDFHLKPINPAPDLQRLLFFRHYHIYH